MVDRQDKILDTCNSTVYPVNLGNIKRQTYFWETCDNSRWSLMKSYTNKCWNLRQQCYSTIDYAQISTVYYDITYIILYVYIVQCTFKLNRDNDHNVTLYYTDITIYIVHTFKYQLIWFYIVINYYYCYVFCSY